MTGGADTIHAPASLKCRTILNPCKGGICKTIYSRVGRLSWENYLGRLEHGGWDCQMTSILEVYEEDTPNEPNAGRNGADAESTIL